MIHLQSREVVFVRGCEKFVNGPELFCPVQCRISQSVNIFSEISGRNRSRTRRISKIPESWCTVLFRVHVTHKVYISPGDYNVMRRYLVSAIWVRATSRRGFVHHYWSGRVSCSPPSIPFRHLVNVTLQPTPENYSAAAVVVVAATNEERPRPSVNMANANAV